MDERKITFTPSDEPYLGRETVHAFDQVIIACMEESGSTTARIHPMEKSDLQWAACQIIPSGISLALSIRELVRQGYLYGALVLMRSLVERSVIVLYLHRFPDKVAMEERLAAQGTALFGEDVYGNRRRKISELRP